MKGDTDWVGVGAVALVGYFLIKKINDIGTSAVNTATNYIEKVTEKVTEKVSDVKKIVHQSTDTVKSYIPGTTTDSDKAYQMYKDTVNSVAAGVDAVSGQDTSNVSRYLYNAGGGYTDQKTGAYIPGAVTNPAYDSDSLNKYTGSTGSNKATVQKVDNVVRVNPTKQTTETSAFTLAMPDYMAAAGNSKSTGSSSGTTVNKGKYAPIKVRK